jgi:hypothetical protein
MSQPVEIIAYRNPLEKMLWDTYLDNPMLILYIIGGCVLVVFLFWLYGWLRDKFNRNRWH